MKNLFLKTFVIACLATNMATAQQYNKTDFEAHRGGRGLMPENTIPAMKNAIDLKVNTLEMDLHITKDRQVVVSHDPYFNPLITTTPAGNYLTPAEAKKILLYNLTYDSIKKYDVGLKPHPDFPQQKKMTVAKPLLSQLLDTTEAYAKAKGVTIRYNMEIKSQSKTDNINHPDPETFVKLVIPLLQQKKVIDRTVIQSFDVRALQAIHALYPQVKLSFLVDKDGGNVEAQLQLLGFIPDTYSPAYKTVTKEMVDACHQKHIKVLPWTPNTKEEIKALLDLGVDGVITDYPDLFSNFR